MKNFNTLSTDQTENNSKKPFYQDDVLMPICVERAGDLENQLYTFDCILETQGTLLHIMEFTSDWFLPMSDSKEGRTFLSGLQQMGKIYHLFAVEQYQILRESIRAEMNKKASI